MDLLQESFQRLFPEKTFSYTSKLEYNRRLSRFNANISLVRDTLLLRLNLEWKDIDDEIKIGLIQHLLLKIFKHKSHTTNIDLYTNFVRNIPLLTTSVTANPTLTASFKRVNALFFENTLSQPHLHWGKDSSRKLASYNFHNDTVRISTLFKESPNHILDYLMYHELLHKHFQFKHHNTRSSYHTSEFKAAERLYPNQQAIEQEINLFLQNHQRKMRKSVNRVKNFLTRYLS